MTSSADVTLPVAVTAEVETTLPGLETTLAVEVQSTLAVAVVANLALAGPLINATSSSGGRKTLEVSIAAVLEATQTALQAVAIVAIDRT